MRKYFRIEDVKNHFLRSNEHIIYEEENGVKICESVEDAIEFSNKLRQNNFINRKI